MYMHAMSLILLKTSLWAPKIRVKHMFIKKQLVIKWASAFASVCCSFYENLGMMEISQNSWLCQKNLSSTYHPNHAWLSWLGIDFCSFSFNYVVMGRYLFFTMHNRRYSYLRYWYGVATDEEAIFPCAIHTWAIAPALLIRVIVVSSP